MGVEYWLGGVAVVWWMETQEMIGESSGAIQGGKVVFRHTPFRSYTTFSFSPNPVSPA
jgi:hypothetical protein